MSLGAATLADLYDPAERGTMMGIYYMAPLLGPALGSLVGGALAQAWNWRADFWFLAIWSGLCFLSFIFVKDTFRKERSLSYQAVLKRAKKDEAASADIELSVTARPRHDSMPTRDIEDVDAQRPSPLTTQPLKDIKISLMDVNPITPIKHLLRRTNNVIILVPSGMFCFNFRRCW
jgi:MFS family permease